jgi:hypothetical protein
MQSGTSNTAVEDREKRDNGEERGACCFAGTISYYSTSPLRTEVEHLTRIHKRARRYGTSSEIGTSCCSSSLSYLFPYPASPISLSSHPNVSFPLKQASAALFPLSTRAALLCPKPPKLPRALLYPIHRRFGRLKCLKQTLYAET